MLKKLSLKFKLIALFLLVGLVPVIVVGVLAYNRAENEIRNEVFGAIQMYAGITDGQLGDYFAEREGDVTVIATTRDVYQSLYILQGGTHQGNTIGVPGDLTDPMWQDRVSILNTLAPTVVREYGYAEMFLTDASGQAVYSTSDAILGADLSDRDYIQGSLAGRVSWSELFFSTVTNANALVVSAPVRSGGNTGELIGTVNVFLDQEGIDSFVHEGLAELGVTADAYLINADGLMLSNARTGEHSQNAALNHSMSSWAVDTLSGPIRSGNMDFEAINEFTNYRGITVLGALEVVQMGQYPVGLIVTITSEEAFAGVMALRNAIIPIIAVCGILIAFVAFFVAMTIVRPVQKISDLTKVLAEGDFTARADIASRDEIGQMAQNLNRTIDSLSETLTRVREASDNVSHASAEISSGNQDLSQRTEEQASSLEEVSSTIEEVTASLESSSANAAEANNLSRGTLESVRQGEAVVQDMQGAMTEITRGSQEISEIISTVNDIAFQTNLLALNAAVEAARAGEQGRGFAVVAAEVRNLAGRSAESAKEIEKLIKDSIVRVEKGNTLMGDTEQVLQKIVTNTQKTSDVVGEIAASLREQSTAAGDIRAAIEELNQVTQQNASLVEEIASSSENMNSEAVELSDKVSFFKLSTNGYKRPEQKPLTVKQVENGSKVSFKKNNNGTAVGVGADLELREEDFEKF